MANLADLLLAYAPLPTLPHYLTHYVPGQTPLSTTPQVVSALVGYLAVVFGLRELMKDREPLSLKPLFRLHNILLSGGSLLLLVLMLEEVLPIVWKHGLFYAICNGAAWTQVCDVRVQCSSLTDVRG